MTNNVRSDATPFPHDKQPEFAEVPLPPDKEENKKKEYESEESSSDSDDSYRGRNSKPAFGGTPSNVINIDHASNVQIGNKYMYSRTVNYSAQNPYKESDYSGASAPNENERGPKPSEELLNSEREINADDIYVVAENISIQWKKLARFLPPKFVFSDGQLRTFEENNPHNLEEVVYEMLQTWKKKYPEQATIGILACTLWIIGKGDISRKLTP